MDTILNEEGFWRKVYSPERAKKVLCEAKEEEYHWLIHEDIAIIAYAMMDPENRTYRDLGRSMEERFKELSKYGGLARGDYAPREIARSIASHNLYPKGNRNFEKALEEESHQIPIQPYNGESGHNYLFWRSRSGNILQHHSDAFRKIP